MKKMLLKPVFKDILLIAAIWLFALAMLFISD
jgi:hypothetical protein